MAQPAILIDLNRCIGCWTCSLSCKVGNALADDEWWQYVRTMGSGAGIDKSAGTWPDLWMKWIPIFTQDCIMCGERTEQSLEPFCTYNCPTEAMIFGDLEDPASPISMTMNELKELGYRLFQIPEWEHTRSDIYYAEK